MNTPLISELTRLMKDYRRDRGHIRDVDITFYLGQQVFNQLHNELTALQRFEYAREDSPPAAPALMFKSSRVVLDPDPDFHDSIRISSSLGEMNSVFSELRNMIDGMPGKKRGEL